MDASRVFAASRRIQPIEATAMFEKRSLQSGSTFGSYADMDPQELEACATASEWKRTTHRHVSKEYNLYVATKGMPTGYVGVQDIEKFDLPWVFLEDIKRNGRLLATSPYVPVVETKIWCVITRIVWDNNHDEEVPVVILADWPTRLKKIQGDSHRANRWCPTLDAMKLGVTDVILDRSLPEDD